MHASIQFEFSLIDKPLGLSLKGGVTQKHSGTVTAITDTSNLMLG